MCTVVVLAGSEGGYVLGHNRDERRTRSRGTPPSRGLAEGLAFLAPGDPDGGGTWIGVNEAGLTACLLNAAESPGRVLPGVSPSRGLLVGEAMGCRSLDGAIARFVRRDSEWGRRRAFHLVLCAPGKAGEPPAITRLAWDGAEARWTSHRAPVLFTSSTFDGTGVDTARREAFSLWLAVVPEPDDGALASWLAGHEPERGPYSVCMHREESRTVARTVVTAGPAGIVLDYIDGSPCSPDGPRVVARF